MLNATSLAKSNAVDILTTEVLDNNVDVVAISETWFTKRVAVNGYSLIRKDRSNRKGGGVCFYIKNGVSFEECAFPSLNISGLELHTTAVLIMVALCNRADHYIFILFLLLLSSFFFFFFFFLA